MPEFEEIYHRYFNDVYRYLCSLCQNAALAEELTQETFFKALSSVKNFDGRCKLSVWLCQIAKNTYYTWQKKAAKQTNLEDISEQTACGPNVEDQMIRGETSAAAYRALHHLPEPYREVFSLRVLGELPFSQIADLFGKTESWARVTFYRAKCKLMEELQ